MVSIPGLNVSIIRQQTAAGRNQPVQISGKATWFGLGVPLLVRVTLEGPAANPERRTFSTLSRPITGDYAVVVFGETDGEYTLQAEAFAPVTVPIPGFEAPVIGPPLGESIEPPLIIGDVQDGRVSFDGRVTPVPPPTEIEIRPEIIVAPIFNLLPGGPGGPPAFGAPSVPDVPAEVGITRPAPPALPTPALPAPPATPAPTPPAQPPATLPLPGEAVDGTIAAIIVADENRDLQPGARTSVRVTYRNTGNIAHAFSVVVAVGTLIPQTQQVRPDVLVRRTGPGVAPGQGFTLDIPLTLPTVPPQGFGDKDVLVQLVDLDPTGSVPVRVYDQRTRARVFRLVQPAAPQPQELAAFFRPGEVDIEVARIRPSTAAPGDSVTAEVTLRNLTLTSPSDFPAGTVRVRMAIVDSAGGVLLNLPERSLTPQIRTVVEQAAALPSGTPPGTYGLLVEVLDGRAGSVVFSRIFPGLLAVGVPAAPSPPQITVAGLTPGTLQLSQPQATPSTANPGDTVSIALMFRSLTDEIAGQVRSVVELVDIQGNIVRQFPEADTSIAPESVATRTLSWTVPQDATEGQYFVRVTAWDPRTLVTGDPNTLLLSGLLVPAGFVVRRPAIIEVLPAAAELRVREIGIQVDSQRLTSVTVASDGTTNLQTAAVVPVGATVFLFVIVENSGGEPGTVEVRPRLVRPDGGSNALNTLSSSVPPEQRNTFFFRPETVTQRGNWGVHVSAFDAGQSPQVNIFNRTFPLIFRVV